MYKLKSTPVNIPTEVADIAGFISTRWTGLPEDFTGFITFVAEAAHKTARFWFESSRISDEFRSRVDVRTKILEAFDPHRGTLLAYYDRSFRLNYALARSTLLVREAVKGLDGPWDHERLVMSVLRKAYVAFPALAGAKPAGWEALAKGYKDFDGQLEYCNTQQDKDDTEFQGADTAGDGASSIPCRIALPYVMYDNYCQGRKPPYVLVSAIFGHFLRIAEHNNTLDILAEVEKHSLDYEVPHAVWEVPQPVFVNPVLAVLLSQARASMRLEEDLEKGPQEKFLEAVKAAEAFEALSAEEQAHQKALRSASVKAVLASLKSPVQDNKYELEHKANVAQCQAALKCFA